jgi:hypothetical protein
MMFRFKNSVKKSVGRIKFRVWLARIRRGLVLYVSVWLFFLKTPYSTYIFNKYCGKPSTELAFILHDAIWWRLCMHFTLCLIANSKHIQRVPNSRVALYIRLLVILDSALLIKIDLRFDFTLYKGDRNCGLFKKPFQHTGRLRAANKMLSALVSVSLMTVNDVARLYI